MNWKVINASVRGSAHQRTGMPNQDAVDYGVAPKGDPLATVLAVSDGHGGGRHFRSQVGSTLAVHVSVKMVRDYLAKPSANDDTLIKLTQEITEAWTAAVHSDLTHNPFTEAELGALTESDGGRSRELVLDRPELAYGATLLLAAVTDSRMIYLQLGDGDILAVEADGTTACPIAPDARLVGNQTTSLCQPEAWREFRTAETSGSGMPMLVLLSTDGYVNSFRSQEDFLQIGKDYLQMLREQGSEALAEELPKILTEATQQGSGDDITLGMLHAEVLPAATAVIKEPAAASKPGVSKSVIIRELTNERSSQEEKLNQLESNYAGARKHVLQLRLLVGAIVLVALGILTQQYWRPLLVAKGGKTPTLGPTGAIPKKPEKGAPTTGGKGEPVAGEPVTDPAASPVTEGGQVAPSEKPPAGTPAGEEMQCVLGLSTGSELILTAGKSITSTDLALDKEKHPYAKVKRLDNILVLTNLSGSAWTVTSPTSGKKSTFSAGDSVPLRADTTIVFNKNVSGSVTFRSKPS